MASSAFLQGTLSMPSAGKTLSVPTLDVTGAVTVDGTFKTNGITRATQGVTTALTIPPVTGYTIDRDDSENAIVLRDAGTTVTLSSGPNVASLFQFIVPSATTPGSSLPRKIMAPQGGTITIFSDVAAGETVSTSNYIQSYGSGVIWFMQGQETPDPPEFVAVVQLGPWSAVP